MAKLHGFCFSVGHNASYGLVNKETGELTPGGEIKPADAYILTTPAPALSFETFNIEDVSTFTISVTGVLSETGYRAWLGVLGYCIHPDRLWNLYRRTLN